MDFLVKLIKIHFSTDPTPKAKAIAKKEDTSNTF